MNPTLRRSNAPFERRFGLRRAPSYRKKKQGGARLSLQARPYISLGTPSGVSKFHFFFFGRSTPRSSSWYSVSDLAWSQT